jgi:hypothetical protein
MTSSSRPLRIAAAVPLLAAIALSTFAGCASISPSKWKASNWSMKKAVGLEPEKPDPVVPERMVATWVDTTLSTVGKKPQRGFGGKLMFFEKGTEDPVRVEGNLVVYAFDETDRPDHETHPTRKYIFPMEEFVRHESDSSLGPAYSFWLPWDEVGGQQRNISLIAKFEPKGGPVVLGEQTRHLLPGVTIDPNAGKPMLTKTVQTDNGEQIRLTTYDGQSAAAVGGAAAESSIVVPSPPKQMSTATIPLPKRLGEAAKAEQTTAYDSSTSSRPLSQISKMQASASPLPGEFAQAAQAPMSDSGVVQAAAMMPVAPTVPAQPAATVTTASERRAMIDAAKASSKAAPGSLRDSLLQTLPARAAQGAR